MQRFNPSVERKNVNKFIALISALACSWSVCAGQEAPTHLVCNVHNHKNAPNVYEFWLYESEGKIGYMNPEVRLDASFSKFTISWGFTIKNNFNYRHEINRESGSINIFVSGGGFQGESLFESGKCSLASELTKKF